jgi:hypothetical protein
MWTMRFCLLAFFVFFPMLCIAQRSAPLDTYTLDAVKHPNEPWSRSGNAVLALSPNSALIALIPQGHGKWIIKRVTGWENKSPREETVTLRSEISQRSNPWITADLTVSPRGDYVVARVTSHRGAVGPSGRDWNAVVAVVDLKTFQIVLERDTTDPLIAGSEWAFTADGGLVAKGLAKRMVEKTDNMITDEYEASALSLPALLSKSTCRFDLKYKPGEREQIASDATESCDNLLKTAGGSSLANLFGTVEGSSQIQAACPVLALLTVAKLGVVECSTGHSPWFDWDGDFFVVTSRTIEVHSFDGRTVLAVPVGKKQSTAAALAREQEHDYLLLLRDGVRLETYSLP